MDAAAAARNWADTWARAWATEDVEAIVALYAVDAVYTSHPFREPTTAREYVEWAFGDEHLERCWFGDPVAAGDRAAVEYWAILSADEKHSTLAGTTVLRFDPGGLVTHHRDYWAMIEGRREPPAGWGR